MRIDVLTLFPEMFIGPLTESMIKRAIEKKIIDIYVHDLKLYTSDKHRKCDDYPYGGGEGMVLKVEPFWRCVNEVVPKSNKRREQQEKERWGLCYTYVCAWKTFHSAGRYATI